MNAIRPYLTKINIVSGAGALVGGTLLAVGRFSVTYRLLSCALLILGLVGLVVGVYRTYQSSASKNSGGMPYPTTDGASGTDTSATDSKNPEFESLKTRQTETQGTYSAAVAKVTRLMSQQASDADINSAKNEEAAAKAAADSARDAVAAHVKSQSTASQSG